MTVCIKCVCVCVCVCEGVPSSCDCFHSDQHRSRDTASRYSPECEKASCVTVSEW